MLYLLFELENEPYALEAARIICLLPFARVEPVAHVAPAVLGTIAYAGLPVPVINLGMLTLGRGAVRRLSTRIVLLHHVVLGESRVLGVVVERATQLTRCKPTDFSPPKRDPDALLARIDPSLFSEATAQTHSATLAAGHR